VDSAKYSAAQVGRLEVVGTGWRQRWSEDERLKIVLESLPGRGDSATIGHFTLVKFWGAQRLDLRFTMGDQPPCQIGFS